ncbi:MAG: MFS transporter [Acidobacteria bacterium]|nr:MFS transporter [Acidobacteriota bacterium]MCL5288859.1 MFS transporter [Acidobacteriota bacterium]
MQSRFDRKTFAREIAKTPLTQNQIRGFWASWLGWALDGMDSFIYALVMVPALTELLPRVRIPSSAANIGYYGGLLFALFLIGWGLSLLWGPIADRFGRVRTLALTVLCYSLFTFLGAVAASVWQLAAFRLLAGIGIGGEWSMGGTFVAEEWPEDRRKMAAGYLHTGYYVGFFLAAIANYLIGSRYGWRAMFALGGAPALLVGFIRYGVAEPQRWKKKMDQISAVILSEAKDRRPERGWTMGRAFLSLFSRQFRRRTLLNATYLLVSITGLWAGSVYVPAAIGNLAVRQGLAASATSLASYGTMLLSVGTILGCLVLPPLAERLGRRRTLGFYFLLMFVFILLAFGYVFYLLDHALAWFMLCLFFLGFGGANFAMYTLWLPEQYPTECRASAFAFATSAGRFVGAGITFLVGAGVSHFGTIGTPVALTSIAFAIGLLLLPFGEETRGQPLPL